MLNWLYFVFLLVLSEHVNVSTLFQHAASLSVQPNSIQQINTHKALNPPVRLRRNNQLKENITIEFQSLRAIGNNISFSCIHSDNVQTFFAVEVIGNNPEVFVQCSSLGSKIQKNVTWQVGRSSFKVNIYYEKEFVTVKLENSKKYKLYCSNVTAIPYWLLTIRLDNIKRVTYNEKKYGLQCSLIGNKLSTSLPGKVFRIFSTLYYVT